MVPVWAVLKDSTNPHPNFLTAKLENVVREKHLDALLHEGGSLIRWASEACPPPELDPSEVSLRRLSGAGDREHARAPRVPRQVVGAVAQGLRGSPMHAQKSGRSKLRRFRGAHAVR